MVSLCETWKRRSKDRLAETTVRSAVRTTRGSRMVSTMLWAKSRAACNSASTRFSSVTSMNVSTTPAITLSIVR